MRLTVWFCLTFLLLWLPRYVWFILYNKVLLLLNMVWLEQRMRQRALFSIAVESRYLFFDDLLFPCAACSLASRVNWLSWRKLEKSRIHPSVSHCSFISVTLIVLQLEFPAQLPCLLHIARCSALCNESVLQYNPDKGNYEKIGEATEVALRVLAEKVGLLLSVVKNCKSYHCYLFFLFISSFSSYPYFPFFLEIYFPPPTPHPSISFFGIAIAHFRVQSYWCYCVYRLAFLVLIPCLLLWTCLVSMSVHHTVIIIGRLNLKRFAFVN